MNIKGKTIIELSDAKTGKLVQKTEDNNMLTNALTYFYKQGGMTNPTAFNADGLRGADVIPNLLGGILCLDTALSEDATIVRVPAGVGMTANGAYNVLNTGNPPELGSYNENESGWQQDGSFKMVWDFTTSQGNGTVACVCLTSRLEGYKGIGNKASNTAKTANILTIENYNGGWGKGLGEYPTILGYHDNKLHVFNRYQGRLNWTLSDLVDKMTVNEYSYPVTSIDIRETMEARLLNTYELTIPSPLHGQGGSVVYAVMDSYCKNGIAYIMVGGYYNPSNPTISGEVYVLKYNIANHAFTDCIALTADGANNNIWGISDKYVIIGKEAIEFDNPANAIDLADAGDIITTVYDGTIGKMKAFDSDTFEGYYSRDGWSHILRADIDAEAFYQCNGAGLYIDSVGDVANNPLMKIAGRMTRDPRYIATINNLSSPVTKTADKTMKVTYILRFS